MLTSPPPHILGSPRSPAPNLKKKDTFINLIKYAISINRGSTLRRISFYEGVAGSKTAGNVAPGKKLGVLLRAHMA